VGKVEELGTSRRLGYTTRGQLVGHVGLGLEIVERHVSKLPGSRTIRSPMDSTSVLPPIVAPSSRPSVYNTTNTWLAATWMRIRPAGA